MVSIYFYDYKSIGLNGLSTVPLVFLLEIWRENKVINKLLDLVSLSHTLVVSLVNSPINLFK